MKLKINYNTCFNVGFCATYLVDHDAESCVNTLLVINSYRIESTF